MLPSAKGLAISAVEFALGYVIANQVALVVVQRLAIDSGDGHLSAYTFAFIFFQLPHGLLAVSLMTTFMPDLSALANLDDYRRQYVGMIIDGRRVVAISSR